jgi:hypothetical protein
MFSTLISQKKRDFFCIVLTYSYLCKRSLARYSSVNAGVTFVGKTITALADYSVHLET